MESETTSTASLNVDDPLWQQWGPGEDETRHVDLDALGVDAASVLTVPPDLAVEYAVVPVRVVDGTLVLAVSRHRLNSARRDLPRRLGRPLAFVTADASDVARAIEICYLPLTTLC
jgi:hypothetical protein